MELNYYELLNVDPKADKSTIKKAYIEEIKKWHPDRNKNANATEMASKLNEAKEVLLDDEKRSRYDLYLKEKQEQTYQRYTYKRDTKYSSSSSYNGSNVNQKASYKEESKHDEDEYETLTKWQYFREYLRHSSDGLIRKVLAIIGVGLETLLCSILRLLILLFAFISYLVYLFIDSIMYVIVPLFTILLLVIIYNKNKEVIKIEIILFIVFLLIIFMPIINDILLSPKTFDFIYNKIDIRLFKKCVGYRDQ